MITSRLSTPTCGLMSLPVRRSRISCQSSDDIAQHRARKAEQSDVREGLVRCYAQKEVLAGARMVDDFFEVERTPDRFDEGSCEPPEYKSHYS